jgi:DNA-binding NarL/FixJ family response regulator
MKKISIVIADDHKLVREVWAGYLNDNERFHVVATTGDAGEAIELAKIHRPDVFLMDINLTPFSGIEATQKIHAVQPLIRIIGVSVYTQPMYAKRLLQMGALGYVTKNSPKEEMVTAILEVYKGNKYICTEIKNIISEELIEGKEKSADISKLTEREREIIQLIKIGKSSKEIAEFLNIALKTVEVHRHNILKKLKLSNTSALVNFINSSERYF